MTAGNALREGNRLESNLLIPIYPGESLQAEVGRGKRRVRMVEINKS
jgi:hypothetical protein